MAIKYLYYTEDTDTGGYLSAACAVPLLDQILYMYDGERMCIHPVDADYGPSAAENYPTLADAQIAYSAYSWIYLDPKATKYLDELTHPVSDVVYAVGHDLTGFDGAVGNTYKLRVVPENFDGHAIVCLSICAVDRWIRQWP